MTQNLYPLSPQVDDLSFIKANRQYRMQAMLVLMSIILFFLIYMAMIAGSIYLIYWSIAILDWRITSIYIGLARLGIIAATVMLFIFLLKFLFKKQNAKNPLLVEIKEKDHPRLFAFIRQLSKELNAPFPKKVFVNHEINASVFYNSTVLSLFLPVKKNLLIGLGLVNSLNLSEFKAVLAHEFGHFSQKSMKLGSYIYMANSIIHSMVYERDKWDELLDQWRGSDIRLAIFGWLLTPIVWLIRQTMQLIYQLINLVHASLSRQMEFQADRVAVSVTGNQAIVNSLYKLNINSEAFAFSNNQVGTAFDHKLYTNDLFFHHTKAFEHLKKNYPDFEAKLLANQNRERLFDADDANHIQMYASHPPNYLREESVKEVALEGIVDDRSPWELFDDPEGLRHHVTQNLIKISLNLSDKTTFHSPEEVEDFIQKELSETTYAAQYLGVYDDRFLADIELADLPQMIEALAIKPDNVLEVQAELYGAPLTEKTNAVKARHQDMAKLYGILTKQDKSKTFQIRGEEYKPKQAQELYEELAKENEADLSWYNDFDKKVLASHYLMLEALPEKRQNFNVRYGFHLAFQRLLKQFNEVQGNLQDLLNQVYGSKEELSDSQITVLNRRLFSYKDQYEKIIKQMQHLKLPQLQNMESVASLAAFVKPDSMPLSANFYDGESVNQLYEAMNYTGNRARRIYFKSLGGLLNTMEEIRSAYQEKS